MEAFDGYMARMENGGHCNRMKEVLGWVIDDFPDLRS